MAKKQKLNAFINSQDIFCSEFVNGKKNKNKTKIPFDFDRIETATIITTLANTRNVKIDLHTTVIMAWIKHTYDKFFILLIVSLFSSILFLFCSFSDISFSHQMKII